MSIPPDTVTTGRVLGREERASCVDAAKIAIAEAFEHVDDLWRLAPSLSVAFNTLNDLLTTVEAMEGRVAELEGELAAVNDFRSDQLAAIRNLVGEEDQDDEALLGSVCAMILTWKSLAAKKRAAEAAVTERDRAGRALVAALIDAMWIPSKRMDKPANHTICRSCGEEKPNHGPYVWPKRMCDYVALLDLIRPLHWLDETERDDG